MGMDLLGLATDGLWAGLFAIGVGVLFTAPPRYLGGTFLCAAVGRMAVLALMGWGVPQNWATVVAAAVVVFVAVAIIRERAASPVVLISAVIPLGAAVATFNTIVGIIKVSSLQGEALGAASIDLSANMGKAFSTSLAVGLGLAAGIAVARLFRRGNAGTDA